MQVDLVSFKQLLRETAPKHFSEILSSPVITLLPVKSCVLRSVILVQILSEALDIFSHSRMRLYYYSNIPAYIAY
jgi:hypothetical protein